jgi:hypothetical protein
LPTVPKPPNASPFGLPGLDASSPIFNGYVPATTPGITPLGTPTKTDEAATPEKPGVDKILIYGGLAIAGLIILPKLFK